jgi:hypothetical protein
MPTLLTAPSAGGGFQALQIDVGGHGRAAQAMLEPNSDARKKLFHPKLLGRFQR